MGHKITYEIDGFAAATKRDMQDAQRDTWRFIGKYWHKFYKAIKFTGRGAKKYGYTPRAGNPGSGKPWNGSYAQRKAQGKANGQGVRSIKENKPNVWSGQSRALAMASQKVKATAASSGRGAAEIIINAPALNFKNPNSRVNPRKEVETVTEDELRDMQRVGTNRYARNLGRIRRRKTVRTR